MYNLIISLVSIIDYYNENLIWYQYSDNLQKYFVMCAYKLKN